MSENTSKYKEVSDIDRFENTEWNFDIEKTREANKSKGFVRVKPSDIMSTMEKQFDEGKPMGLTTGIPSLDPYFRWRRKGGLYLLSAYEGAGKSEFLKFITYKKTLLYRTKNVIFSPEEETEDIFEDLTRVYLKQNTNKMFKGQCSKQDWNRAVKWVEDNYFLLEYDGMVDFKTLLEEYEALAKLGYTTFITDPWNYIAEGSMGSSNSIDYLKVALSHMKTFSKRYHADNIVVEHQNQPKMKQDGSYPLANKFNITGGSMWRNKLDVIMLLHNYWTQESKDTSVDVEIAKSKAQRYNGQRGTARLNFDIATGHYLEISQEREDEEIEFYHEPKDNDVPF